MRLPLVAGQFYPKDKKELLEMIEGFISKAKEKGKNAVGIISPHAGYVYSGLCASLAHSSLKKFDTYIVLGLSHYGYPTALSDEDWQTPLGVIDIDRDLTKELSKKIPIDNNSHRIEHSIEVQLPFIQYFSPDSKLIALNCSPDFDPKELAKIIYSCMKKQKREGKIGIIASSDFTHYGLNYDYIPFIKEIKKKMYELDRKAISCIEKLDSDAFLNYIGSTGSTICGKYPIAVFIELMKSLAFKRAELITYYTSADVIGDYSSSVGYAAIEVK